jgi:hypothetical protein
MVIKSRRMSWVGHVACMEEMRNACSILFGRYEGMRKLRRRWCSSEDNIRLGNRAWRCGLNPSASG